MELIESESTPTKIRVFGYGGKYCLGILMYFYRQAFFLCAIFYSMVSDGVTLKIMTVVTEIYDCILLG